MNQLKRLSIGRFCPSGFFLRSFLQTRSIRAMAPKRQSAKSSVSSTKKLTLKAKTKPKPISEAEVKFCLETTSKISTGANLNFKAVVNESTSSDLKELEAYLKKHKSNISSKLECFSEILSPIKKIVSLRDWLNEVIQQSSDQLHDQVILEFGGSAEEFEFEDFKSYISNKVGEKTMDDV